MKKFTSMMLVFALILGFVPGIAPVNATAADATLYVTCASGVKNAVENKISNSGVQNDQLNNYTGLDLSFTGSSLSSEDWAYLRQIFTEYTKLETLTFGTSTFKSIPAATDSYSPHWTKVSLPDTLTSIGNSAFRKSASLTSIFITKSVSSIGTLAFAGCTSLTAINVDSANKTYKNLNDGVVYSDAYANLCIYPAGKTGDADGAYTIPTGVKTLGIGCFADSQLKKLTIPVAVTTITNAFVQTPGETITLKGIYFNASSPPKLSTGGLTSYESTSTYLKENVTIYVPKPSVSTYKNSSNYLNKFFAVSVNDGDDAEILGIKIDGFVGIGAYSGNSEDYIDSSDDDDEDEDEAGDDDEDDADDDEVISTYEGYAYIDLSAETLTVDIQVTSNGKTEKAFKVAGYSVNGTSWTAGDLTAAKLATALNSASAIKLCNSFNSSTKKPNTDSDIISFPIIQARPASNSAKLKLFYNDETWGLVKAYTDTAFYASMTSYSYVIGDASGKLPADPNWSNKIPAEGVKIADYPEKGVKKAVYYLRADAYKINKTDTADAKYYPNSKTWKVTPATKSKAPNYKVDYKKERIKVKKGDIVVGTDMTGSAKTEYSVTDLLNGTATSVKLVKLATGKKPGSMTQTLELAQRGTLTDTSFETNKGKIKDRNTKLYEFSSNGTTWGKMPKFSANTTIYVRLKQNVKVRKGVIEGTAASDAGTFTIEWGVYDEEKSKSGILSAVITVNQPQETTPAEPEPESVNVEPEPASVEVPTE